MLPLRKNKGSNDSKAAVGNSKSTSIANFNNTQTRSDIKQDGCQRCYITGM